MNTPSDSQRQTLPPHAPPADAVEYLKACTQEERDLVQLAISQLGSSYFMEKSHGYLAWKAKQVQTQGSK
jgi:hypothetical protein